MDKDFHYGVIKLLAIKAEFNESDAQVLAYASQYVDDAVIHKPIPIGNIDEFRQKVEKVFEVLSIEKHKEVTLLKNDKFNPICTAHTKIQNKIMSMIPHVKEIYDFLKEILSDMAQRKVYIPFHFLPTDKENYCVTSGSPFAREVLSNALGIYRNPDLRDDNLGLIALGIALHSFADTWSHEGFSGRHNSENDIEDLLINIDEFIDDHETGTLPDLGHLEAKHYPDMPHIELEFTFEKKVKGRERKVRRKNYLHFLIAAKEIFSILCDLKGHDSGTVELRWNSIEETLHHIFKTPMEENERLDYIHEQFSEISFLYDPCEWEDAMIDIVSEGNSYDPREEPVYSEDFLWFKFHIAAALQRTFVMNHY